MTYEISIVDLPEQATAVVRGRTTPDEIAGFLGDAFDRIAVAASDQGRRLVGPPFARYARMDDTGWELEAGFPVDRPMTDDDGVAASTLPACRAARLVHTGPYDTVAAAWETATAWIADHDYVATDAPWECYLDEPDVENPRTLVVIPCDRPGRDA